MATVDIPLLNGLHIISPITKAGSKLSAKKVNSPAVLTSNSKLSPIRSRDVPSPARTGRRLLSSENVIKELFESPKVTRKARTPRSKSKGSLENLDKNESISPKQRLRTSSKSLNSLFQSPKAAGKRDASISKSKDVEGEKPNVLRTPNKKRSESLENIDQYLNTPRTSPRKILSSSASTPVKLSESPFTSPRKRNQIPENKLKVARQALHTSCPEQLIKRDKQIGAITSFLDDCISNRKPGSLYVSGKPGTGKTASVNWILSQPRFATKPRVFINCMTVKNPLDIFKMIHAQLNLDTVSGGGSAAIQNAVSRNVTTRKDMLILILDEMDQLSSSSVNQEVLYSIFEWPSLVNSKLVLIGLANALDLTDRLLPRLQAWQACKPQLLHFPPYTREDLVDIVRDRLERCVGVIQPQAITLVAARIASASGDARKVLDTCRRAIEMIEQNERISVLRPTADDGLNPTVADSPKKRKALNGTIPAASVVGVSLMREVMTQTATSLSKSTSAVSVSGASSSAAVNQQLPIQQQFVLCALLVLKTKQKRHDATMGKIAETYARICRQQSLPTVDISELQTACQLLETRGILSVKQNKSTPRDSKVSLHLRESEIEDYLQNKKLIARILEANKD